MELLQVKILNTAIERVLNREMTELGLTFTQATVIGYLLDNADREICQRDIEYNLGLSHPTVSSILNRMEANGLICFEIQSADRRYKKICLTDKAITLSELIGIKYRTIKTRLFDSIEAEQREAFNATVQKLLNNIHSYERSQNE